VKREVITDLVLIDPARQSLAPRSHQVLGVIGAMAFIGIPFWVYLLWWAL
jgi:hypothetical protein